MENQYFEGERNLQNNEDELIKRIKECEMVVDKLATDPVWAVVINDATMWRDQIDSVWQEIFEPEKLLKARVIKTAYAHLIDLPKKYKETLTSLQNNLQDYREHQED